MASTRRFIQCDVFSAVPARGNGLADVVDGQGLSTQDMQAFAAWTNLAETTFLLPPTDSAKADYKLRIFTPSREMLFAGHPTLGSCAAWLYSGGQPRSDDVVRQECGVGIVDIDLSGEVPAFVAPPTKIAPLPEDNLKTILAALEINASDVVRSALLENGPVWQVLELRTAAKVLAVDSSKVRWPQHKSIGLIGAQQPGNECDYEVRMLAPSSGMSEDPITGSLNAAIACWMQAEGRLPTPITVAQGTSIDRIGRVFIRPRDGKVLIGGQTSILIEGTVTL